MPNGIILTNENTELSTVLAISSQKGTIQNDFSGLQEQLGISSQKGTIQNDFSGLQEQLGNRVLIGVLPYLFSKPIRTGQQKQEWYN